MLDIEFLPEHLADAEAEVVLAGGPQFRRWLGPVMAAALALIVGAAVVIGHGGDTAGDHGAGSTPGVTRPLRALPEFMTSGPEPIDVLAVDHQVYELTSSSIAVADRFTGTLSVRPLPPELTGGGTGRLRSDPGSRLLWVVRVGATSLEAFDPDLLDARGLAVSPDPINDAAAMDGQLWFTTNDGVYGVTPGVRTPRRVRGPNGSYGSVAADAGRHRLLVSDSRSPSTVRTLLELGGGERIRVPIDDASIAMIEGKVWATGHVGTDAVLAQLERDSLRPIAHGGVEDRVGTDPTIVASFADRIIVRGFPPDVLFCLDARTGALNQQWRTPPGRVSLAANGVLVTTHHGIRELDARDCLAG